MLFDRRRWRRQGRLGTEFVREAALLTGARQWPTLSKVLSHALSHLQEMASAGLAGLTEFVQEAALLTGDESAADAPGVRLMTLHAAKGLEFDTVFIAGAHFPLATCDAL